MYYISLSISDAAGSILNRKREPQLKKSNQQFFLNQMIWFCKKN